MPRHLALLGIRAKSVAKIAIIETPEKKNDLFFFWLAFKLADMNDIKEAVDFLKANYEVAFATISDGRPQMRVFQIMKFSDDTLWFATGPHKRVYAELQANPAVEILARNGNISVRVSGNAVFDVPAEVCQEIYQTNPVLPRLYADWQKLAYFRVPIDRLDYYDLTPTPPILRHYDRATGQYVDLNPFGQKK